MAATFRPHDPGHRRAHRAHLRVCVIAGVVCAAQLNARIAEHRAVLERSEPFAYAAQNLYAALSGADAAAASAFLSGGNRDAPMRAQYQQALARRGVALVACDGRRLRSDLPHRGRG